MCLNKGLPEKIQGHIYIWDISENIGYIYTKNELVIYLKLSLTGHMFLYSNLISLAQHQGHRKTSQKYTK